MPWRCTEVVELSSCCPAVFWEDTWCVTSAFGSRKVRYMPTVKFCFAEDCWLEGKSHLHCACFCGICPSSFTKRPWCGFLKKWHLDKTYACIRGSFEWQYFLTTVTLETIRIPSRRPTVKISCNVFFTKGMIVSTGQSFSPFDGQNN